MPDQNIAPETVARLERIGLATKLRRAAAELEREGINTIRLWDARGICLAALNDIDRELEYGRPGAGIDELLGEAHG